MAKIHFVDHNGETRIIDVENGATVMEAAIRNAIPGIEAECGGPAPARPAMSMSMRSGAKGRRAFADGRGHADFGFDVRPNSRLSCQIKVSDALDGLIVTTPERQA